MIFINCSKCLLCPYILMLNELTNGLCPECHKTKKEKKTMDDWFDSLFTEPKCDDTA